MTIITKRRIVGTVMLLLIVLMLLPVIFDGPKVRSETDITIDAPPEQDKVKSIVLDLTKEPQQEQYTVVTESNSVNEQSLVVAQPQENIAQPVQDDEVSEAKSETHVAQVENTQQHTVKNTVESNIKKVVEPKKVVEKPALQAEAETKTLASVKKPIHFASKAWVVQLGSFSQSANANALVSSLQSKKYKAFSRQINDDSRPITRVFVGPHLDRTKAEKQLKELEQATQLKGLVVEFQPLIH